MSNRAATEDGTWAEGGAGGERVLLSLLDRLIDLAPDSPEDPPQSSAAALKTLREGVRRDVEALLNARRRWRSWDPRLAELNTSPIGFGLPDFAAGAFSDPRRREELRVAVEASIARFEPRLGHVRVALLPAGSSADGPSATLRLRIEALLRAEPAPEPVSFDTVVDPGADTVTVRPVEG